MVALQGVTWLVLPLPDRCGIWNKERSGASPPGIDAVFPSMSFDSTKAGTCYKTRHQINMSIQWNYPSETVRDRPLQSILHGVPQGKFGFPNSPLPPLQNLNPTNKGSDPSSLPPNDQSTRFPLPVPNGLKPRCSDSSACCQTDERYCSSQHVSQSSGIANAESSRFS